MAFEPAGREQGYAPAPATWRAPAAARIASLAPFFLAVVLQLFAPRYFQPMFTDPTAIMGLPLGAIVGALTLAWAALGALIVWTTHSRLAAALSLAFLSVPSMLALILGPAVILIVQNLG
jgi:hypothetical protein